MRLFAALLLAPLSLAGQLGGIITIPQPVPSATSATQYAAEDLCSVEGQLVNAITGEPVRRGVLTLLRTQLGPGVHNYVANSDADGRFALKNVEPGQYQLRSQHTGFADARYAADGARSAAPLALDRGRKLTGIVIKMTPQGVIAGRILDEDGDPLPYAQVQLLRFQYIQGRKVMLPIGGSATSNDLGEYRVFDFAPGKYYLSVQYRPRIVVRIGVATQEEEEYVTTYYPGATDPASAAPIEVGPGGQVQNVNVRPLRMRTFRVKGKVTGLPASDHMGGVSLTLAPRSNYLGMNRGASVGAAPEGAFEITGVAPGAYTLTATVYAQGAGNKPTYSARQPLDVGTADVSDVVVTVAPPLEVSGRIRVEGTAPPSLKGLMVTLASTEPNTGYNSKAVDDDLTFKLQNVSLDRFYVSVSPLPQGYYLKAVRAGGVDVIDAGLDLTNGAAPAVDIVLSPNAAQVAGVVQSDDPQRPVAGAAVALIPQEKERRNRESYYKTALASDDGRFAFHNLPPGEYKIFAWEEMEAGAYLDPEFVQPQESKGEAVTVREGDKLNVQVKLIPAESAAASR
jgi:hypothetical protein